MYEIFDDTKCALGEGALWHPKLNCLFWFDIISAKLYAKTAEGVKSWSFDEAVSAAAWVDENTLMISSSSGLKTFDIASGDVSTIVEIEADNEITRSNDGRADRQGGFWISTIGHDIEHEAGAIYRYYKGEVRKLHDKITIPNSICFSADGGRAFFTDTPTKKIMSQQLDPSTGWPTSDPEVYLDLTDRGDGPDGAVVDADGNIWIAFWGKGIVEGFDASGKSVGKFEVPAANTTCPAFGGVGLGTLFVTSATIAIAEEDVQSGHHGQTFSIETEFKGLPEPCVIL